MSDPGRLAPAVRETARMKLEPLALVHTDELTRLLGDPRVARTLTPDGRPAARDTVVAWTMANAVHWQRHGFGLWLLRDRQTGEMVGRGGLQYTYAAGLNDVEVAWAIVPERWGEGLATEMARAAIEAAFGTLELPWIVALTLPGNAASRRVMEKTGFVYERDIEHAGLPHVLYERRPHG
jgi:RimJ/RimL family protein N-acetyltransferase